ncbi:MAG: radical SAM protein [Thermoflexales bacterium]|nr:radical SAM protein [Thermoflexales bacterium]
MFDFANILFAGPCNARCPFCIGQQIDPRLSVNNLTEFPPRNLDQFIDLIIQHAIKQVVVTGTTTDPQLYRHEARLLDLLRSRLPSETQYALHTNARLALKKLDTFNLYDRVCISLPTFNAETYVKMMGVRGVPDLATLLDRARVPIKISCLIDTPNFAEISDFVAHCQRLGLKRLVLRQLYGERGAWPNIEGLSPRGEYRGSQVYDYRGLEITFWDFDRSESTSLNLFSSGVISDTYLLAETHVTSG